MKSKKKVLRAFKDSIVLNIRYYVNFKKLKGDISCKKMILGLLNVIFQEMLSEGP